MLSNLAHGQSSVNPNLACLHALHSMVEKNSCTYKGMIINTKRLMLYKAMDTGFPQMHCGCRYSLSNKSSSRAGPAYMTYMHCRCVTQPIPNLSTTASTAASRESRHAQHPAALLGKAPERRQGWLLAQRPPGADHHQLALGARQRYVDAPPVRQQLAAAALRVAAHLQAQPRRALNLKAPHAGAEVAVHPVACRKGPRATSGAGWTQAGSRGSCASSAAAHAHRCMRHACQPMQRVFGRLHICWTGKTECAEDAVDACSYRPFRTREMRMASLSRPWNLSTVSASRPPHPRRATSRCSAATCTESRHINKIVSGVNGPMKGMQDGTHIPCDPQELSEIIAVNFQRHSPARHHNWQGTRLICSGDSTQDLLGPHLGLVGGDDADGGSVNAPGQQRAVIAASSATSVGLVVTSPARASGPGTPSVSSSTTRRCGSSNCPCQATRLRTAVRVLSIWQQYMVLQRDRGM